MRLILFVAASLVFALAVAPAASASDLPTGTRVEGNCVWLWDFPDEGFAVCKGEPGSGCKAFTRHVTFIGTEDRCIA